MTRRSTPAAVLLAVVSLLLVLPTVHAHGNRPVSTEDEPLTIPPGGSEVLGLEVHYHRLVMEVDAGGTPVTLTIVPDDDGAPAPTGDALWRSGVVEGTARFNVLVPCCDDRAWSPLHLVIANTHPTDTAHVRLQAKLVHDDLRVGMTGVEGGPLQPVLVFTVPAALIGHRGLTTLRNGRIPRGASGLDARQLLRRSHGLLLILTLVLSTGALWGAARYGGGAAGGIVAAYGVVFPTLGGIVVFLGILVAWFVAAHLWMRGFERAVTLEPDAGRAVALGGTAQVLVLLAVPLLLVAAYGTEALPIALFTSLPLALVQGAAVGHLLLEGRGGRWVQEG